MTFLENQVRILRLIGYDLRPTESRIRFGLIAANLLLLYAIMWPELTYVLANVDDIKRATDGLCPLMFGFSASARLLTLRLQKTRFYQLIWRMQALWRTARIAEDRSILAEAFRRENRLSFPYILSTGAVGLLYLAFPLALGAYQHWQQVANATWEMPMRSIFVYDIRRSPQYELTYAWFIQATYLAAFGATGVDTLFYAGTFNLSAHFRVIQRHARRIRYARGEGRAARVATEELRHLISYHRRTIELADYLTQTYQPILLIHFAVSSAQICVIAYQLTLPDQDLQGLITYTTFLLAVGFQCFVYCHGGTRLETESAAVADALYDGRWYVGNGRTQKCVGLCVQRAQKAVVVRSVFFSANLFTFSSIFRTAGSYIALLQTISAP